MTERPFLLSGAIGVAVIVIGVVVTITSPGRSAELNKGFYTPVLALEFASESEDIFRIFIDQSSAVRVEIVRAMTISTYIDFLFLVLYGAFLFSFSVVCESLTGNRLYFLIALISLFAPLFDMLENLQMLSIMEQLENEGLFFELQFLQFSTWVKWGVLTLVFLLLVPFLYASGKFGRFLSLFAFIPLILGVLAFQDPGVWNELFALSIMLMFVFMIIFSFTYRKHE